MDSNDSRMTPTTRQFRWSWKGREVVLGLDEAGRGPLLVLLPALSSISTRAEMSPLMQRLASQFRVIALDWPGFGTAPRPDLAWTPDALSAYLGDALSFLGTRPHGVVAAGHAATYILHHAARHPGFADRIALLAPTWRGPLPTMMGGDRPFFGKIRRMVEAPLVGPLLYRLNVNAFVIRHMVVGHVYSDPAWFSPQRLAEKRKVVDAAGARFASVGFVTGGLDRAASRAEFLDLATRAGAPILVVYGAETPSRSRAEIEALAALPDVRSVCIGRGKLSVYEEFPDDVATALRPFLSN